MKILKNIQPNDWSKYMSRPILENEKLTYIVNSILISVKANKDLALKKYALEFDHVNLDALKVSLAELEEASSLVSGELKEAINVAKDNIEKFHSHQQIDEVAIETTKGIKCWRKSVAIEKVGLYIPGGSAPLFSTILMLGLPAKIAGCKEIILCTPSDKNAKVHPAILYTASIIGIKEIYKVGGAQAIAAMAFGTESIPPVYKIFGPGNQYVTKAKQLVQLQGIAIDMPAGPSEVLIIADKTGNPSFIAADLLSQAEHGPDSQVLLLSNDESIIDRTMIALGEQVDALPRSIIAKKALQNSKAILLDSIEDCIEFSNQYAPEHLIIASNQAMQYVDKIVNAGSVFIGNYSCESAGDYASGTNHTLPTNGFAKSYSGVSLDSFVKKITFQEITKEGISAIGSTIEIMAESEELFAHKNAVTLRLKKIGNV